MRLPLGKASIRYSRQNGWIFTSSRGEVWAFGARQTSLRYAQMWGDALKRAGAPADAKAVLMLGLAGAGALPAVHLQCPQASVTCVEYDPAMVAIARERLQKLGLPLPRIVQADALEALSDSTEMYELILVDIFIGLRPSPLVASDEFWKLVKARLAQGGRVVLNVAGDTTMIYPAQEHFRHSHAWQYLANTFCALS